MPPLQKCPIWNFGSRGNQWDNHEIPWDLTVSVGILYYVAEGSCGHTTEPHGVIYGTPMGIITGAALLDNNEATAKSTSQYGGMAVNFG